MLTILGHLVESMVQQAHKDHPVETCGMIAGSLENRLPQRFIPMVNKAKSTDFFEFEPKQYLQVWREMEQRNEVPVVIFHSHTQSIAFPGRADREFALDPNIHYVIISTTSEQKNCVRSFRICNAEVIEERIKAVASYLPVLA